VVHEVSRPGASVVLAISIVPGSDPPARPTADSAETTRRLTEDHDRIAKDINDTVVQRLFSAGLTLETALGLLDGHRAADRIQLAIDELDQAIRDIRKAVFGARLSGSRRAPRGPPKAKRRR
jgi:signal transduction histidine kinase